MLRAGPISIMQEYLSALRKICDWTTEELGNRMGVTKQTISNIENYKVNMTKTQYIALRTIFEYEVNCVNTNIALQKVMLILFYSEVEYDETKEKVIKEAIENLAAAASGGVEGNQLYMLTTTLLAPLKLPVLSQTVRINNKPYLWLEQLKEEE